MIKFIHYQPNKDSKVLKLPVRASYKAMKLMKEEAGLVIGIDDDGTNYEAYETLLYYSLKNGYAWQQEEMPYKKEDMEDIMDQCFQEFMGMLPAFFGENSDNDTTDKKSTKKDLAGVEKK